MPKKIVEAKVIGQHVLNNSTKLIEVYAPELAELAVPGQFVNVQVFNCTAPLLRRPFGVAAVNKKEGTITMITALSAKLPNCWQNIAAAIN